MKSKMLEDVKSETKHHKKPEEPVKVIPLRKEEPTSQPLANFGWATFEKRPAVPFVRRGPKCYVANAIYANKFSVNILKVLSHLTTECIHLKMAEMTQSEADVFNEINVVHCDRNLVGNFHFKTGERMSDLEDVRKSLKFFDACQDAMCRKQIRNELFGFLRIGKEGQVPFIWNKGQKLLPLFYFEGHSEYLETRSVDLTDMWQLGYLKFCCLVQNIRKEHYERIPLKVVELEHIKKLFPTDTVFEFHWPDKPNEELLTPEVRLARLHAGEVPCQHPTNTQATTGRTRQKRTQSKDLTTSAGGGKKSKPQEEVTNVPYRSPQTASSPGLYVPSPPLIEARTSATCSSIHPQVNQRPSLITSWSGHNLPVMATRLAAPNVTVCPTSGVLNQKAMRDFFINSARSMDPRSVDFYLKDIAWFFMVENRVTTQRELFPAILGEMQNIWIQIKQNPTLYNLFWPLSVPVTPITMPPNTVQEVTNVAFSFE